MAETEPRTEAGQLSRLFLAINFQCLGGLLFIRAMEYNFREQKRFFLAYF